MKDALPCYLSNVWPVDGGPGARTNVLRRVVVCVGNVSAGYTLKNRLAAPVGFVDTAAHITSAGCIARVNSGHDDTELRGFVFQLQFEIGESPVGNSSALPMTDLCLNALTDTTELFDSNAALSVVRLSDDLLTDDVVDVVLESGLFAFNLTQFTLGRLRAFVLQVGTTMCECAANLIDLCAAEVVAIRSCGNLDDAHVNTNEVGNVGLIRLFNKAGRGQVKLIVNKAQVGLSDLALHQFKLVFTRLKGQLQPAINRPDRNLFLADLPRQDVVVKLDCAKRQKGAFDLLVDLVGLRNLGFAPDNYAGVESRERFARIVVCDLVQRELSEYFRFPCALRQPVATGISKFNRLFERLSLFIRNNQLDLGRELHIGNYTPTAWYSQVFNTGGGANSSVAFKRQSPLRKDYGNSY